MNWLKRLIAIKRIVLLIVVILTASSNTIQAQTSASDTITTYAVIYNGDTIEAKTLSTVDFYARYPLGKMSAYTRLRNAIIVTYPYALKAGAVMNDINNKMLVMKEKSERKAYIKTREKELKKEFTDPLTNLSIYQGKVLMKLINRETGNNCYEIIKDYKGGFTARFYQTVAFFFSSNLKQPYDREGDEMEMEKILQEVCRTYGYNYSAYRPM